MNVLWIVVDSLRLDGLPQYIDRYGNNGAISALEEDFVRFSEAYTQAAYTVTSATSMLSSRYPPSHGTITIEDSVPTGLPGLEEVAERAGGSARSYPGMSFFSDRWGLNDLVSTVENENNEHYDAKELVNAYLNDDHSSGASLIWFFDLHASKSPHADAPQRGDPGVFDDYLRKLGGILEQLSRLFDMLRERGEYEETAIVFCSDHGDLFDEHYRLEGNPIADLIVDRGVPGLSDVLDPGFLGHLGYPLYDELAHVPLFIKLPSNDHGGKTVSETVELVDILPTVDDLINDGDTANWQGESLLPLIREGEGGKKQVYTMTSPKPYSATYLSVRTPEYVLLEQRPPAWSVDLFRQDPKTYAARRLGTPRQKLYRRGQEHEELSSTYPEIAAELHHDLQDWLDRNPREENEGRSITSERREELEDLGYL